MFLLWKSRPGGHLVHPREDLNDRTQRADTLRPPLRPLEAAGTGLQERVHPAGDEPFQAPADLAAAFAVSSPFRDVGAGFGVVGHPVMAMVCIARLSFRSPLRFKR